MTPSFRNFQALSRLNFTLLACACVCSAVFAQPPASGQSLPAVLYRENADKVVYMTGLAIQPEKKLIAEFFYAEDEKPSRRQDEEWTVGSGFLIHPAGYVLTNAHSVMRSASPVVELRNGSQYAARILALRRNQDLALVKFTPQEPLQNVTFAPPYDISVGDEIIIIGAPHTLKFTLTRGIISGTGRSSQLEDISGVKLWNLLQTDAAINPGTSGGPWFDMRGEVVAMTVSKRSDADNIGFGISAETLHRMLPEMLLSHLKHRFDPGFSVSLAKRQPPDSPHLCWVSAVEENTPASENGMKVGDVLLAVNNQSIHAPMDFYLHLLDKEAIDTLSLQLRRQDGDEAPKILDITLPLSPAPQPDPYQTIRARLKLGVRPLAEEKVKAWNLRSSDGVEITELDDGIYSSLDSPPKVGDVLVKVNHQRPQDIPHLARILADTPPGTQMDFVFLRAELKDKKTNYIRIDVRNLKTD